MSRKMWSLLKGKRPVPMRSMIKGFTKDSVLQIDQGNLIICLKPPVLSKLTMDQGNLMSVTAQAHTQWKNKLLLKTIVTLRYSTRTTSSIVQSTKKTSTSTFQDYHILPWNNCMAPAFENWFRKSRITLIDTLFNAISNKVNNLIPSAKNQKKWFVKLGTSNCLNCSTWNPKHNAKYVCHTGTSASSTARAGTLAKRNGGEKEICTIHHGSPLDSQLLHQERTTPWAPLREEARGSRVLHREFAEEEMQEE